MPSQKEKRKIESHRKTISNYALLHANCMHKTEKSNWAKKSSQRVLNLKTGFRLFCLFGHLSDHRCVLFNPCLFCTIHFHGCHFNWYIPVVNWCFFRIVCHSHWTHLRWNTKNNINYTVPPLMITHFSIAAVTISVYDSDKIHQKN